MCWFWWSSGRQVLPCELRPDLTEHPRGPENNKLQCYTTCYKIRLKNGNCEGTLTQTEEDLNNTLVTMINFHSKPVLYWLTLTKNSLNSPKKKEETHKLCIALFNTIIIFVLCTLFTFLHNSYICNARLKK